MDRDLINWQAVSLGATLAVEAQLQLRAPFTGKDIKAAMFSIPNLKSPGPDGFNCGFFKTNWQLIGDMACDTIQLFFQTSHMPSHFGQTKMILLPEVPNPPQAKDFRPISCCIVIYKCIAKLLYNKLKEVLPQLI